ncbi:hypothetical protein ACTQ1U_12395 [Thermoguttaceae bacterium LCP21S3_D4]
MEVGEETFLADLCREFTTVVTRGCVKTITVTNAPIIVLASDYTLEEEQRYQNRQEQEVTEDFLKKIYVMLEKNPKAVITVIGN